MKSKIFLGIAALLCLVSFATADSYQMYLKLEGIPGEASFQNHEHWINVLSWSWGTTQSGSMHKPIVTVTQTSWTGPKLESINSLDGMTGRFTKWVDKSSAALLSHFQKKIKIPSAKLCLIMVIGEKETTWTYELKNVMVTSHAQEDKKETLTINYETITGTSK